MISSRHVPFSLLRRDLDSLFEDFFGSSSAALRKSHSDRTASYPAIRAWEDEHSFVVEAQLPGVTQDALDISVSENEITISGKRNLELPEGATVHRQEIGNLEFSRTLSLGESFDSDAVEAALRNGILTITLGKSEKAKPRKISLSS